MVVHARTMPSSTEKGIFLDLQRKGNKKPAGSRAGHRRPGLVPRIFVSLN
jgi:hypothetical protein